MEVVISCGKRCIHEGEEVEERERERAIGFSVMEGGGLLCSDGRMYRH